MTLAVSALVLLTQIPSAPKAESAPAAPRWAFHGESRMWLESREGFDFGRQPSLLTALVRHRLTFEVRPARSLKFAATMQDTRAPNYGRPRPGSAQDPFDLHEAYVEFAPDAKTGWTALAGRKRFAYRDWIVIGLPEWSNSGRTYDTAQLRYRWAKSSLNFIGVSAVRFDPARFNRIQPRDHMAGFYFESQAGVDVFYFRHARLDLSATHSIGTRLERRFNSQWRASAELIAQDGGFGGVLTLARKLGPVEIIPDYEFATRDFDQIYGAQHNRYGHSDVLGFRNLHSLQVLTRIPSKKHTRLHFLYTSNWLMDATRPAYNLSGGVIVRDPLGRSGRHLGQEAAFYTTHQFGRWQVGLAVAQWFNGRFFARNTPGASVRYTYLHLGYMF
jgi:hypothetical protein